MSRLGLINLFTKELESKLLIVLINGAVDILLRFRAWFWMPLPDIIYDSGAQVIINGFS